MKIFSRIQASFGRANKHKVPKTKRTTHWRDSDTEDDIEEDKMTRVSDKDNVEDSSKVKDDLCKTEENNKVNIESVREDLYKLLTTIGSIGTEDEKGKLRTKKKIAVIKQLVCKLTNDMGELLTPDDETVQIVKKEFDVLMNLVTPDESTIKSMKVKFINLINMITSPNMIGCLMIDTTVQKNVDKADVEENIALGEIEKIAFKLPVTEDLTSGEEIEIYNGEEHAGTVIHINLNDPKPCASE